MRNMIQLLLLILPIEDPASASRLQALLVCPKANKIVANEELETHVPSDELNDLRTNLWDLFRREKLCDFLFTQTLCVYKSYWNFITMSGENLWFYIYTNIVCISHLKSLRLTKRRPTSSYLCSKSYHILEKLAPSICVKCSSSQSDHILEKRAPSSCV